MSKIAGMNMSEGNHSKGNVIKLSQGVLLYMVVLTVRLYVVCRQMVTDAVGKFAKSKIFSLRSLK